MKGFPGAEGRAAACLQSQRSRSLLVLSTLVPFLLDMLPSTSPSLFRMVCINMPWCLSGPPLEGTHCLSPHPRAVSLVLFFTGLDPGAIADLCSCLCPQGISAVNRMLLVCVQTIIPWASGALNAERLCVLLAWHLASETVEALTFSS